MTRGVRPHRGDQQLKLEGFGDCPTTRAAMWSASCSTEYARDARPMRPELAHRVDIAVCNESLIMQLEEGQGELWPAD